MTAHRLTLRHLVFTGPGRPPAELEFGEGSNLVWGASNTGKSFTLKAINFMLGGSSPLPDIDERQGYDTVLLGISISGAGDFTFSRSVAGGDYLLHDGLLKAVPTGITGRQLSAKHSHDKPGNLSNFLLSNLGFGGKIVAKDSYGTPDSLSFRDLAKILLVDETSIQAERSPIAGGQHPDVPTERSVFRLLLSGVDDSAVVPVAKPKSVRAAKAFKLELLDEMIGDLDARLAAEHPEADGYAEQDARLTETLDRIQSEFDAAQKSVRSLLGEKQALAAEIPRVGSRLDEIEVHLDRFARLNDVYGSDVERLVAIEEAGFLVSLGSGRDCPMCGAKPEAQSHGEGIVQVEQVRAAALAEIEKIARQRDDLARTVEDLHAERGRLENEFPALLARLERTERDLADLLPQVDEARRSLAEVLTARDRTKQGLALQEQRQLLLDKRREAESMKAAPKEDKPNLDLSGGLAHDFCQTVAEVLRKWEFPGDRHISFDESTYDLKIDGKLRINNGKGVRAVTHAAFKVALLLFCRDRGLPHPGIVVLDTPLLTYRDPIKNPRFGELSEDEKALARTAVKQRFFEHIHSIRDLGQFIVFENVDLPVNIEDLAKVEVFSGGTDGRRGLFPAMPAR
jgi:hypothetical protein